MVETFRTVEHAAQLLKLHPKTVLRFIHEGRLRATRIGKSYRIQQSDLNALAGVQSGVQASAAVTSIIEAKSLEMDQAQRLASFLNAAIMNTEGRADAIHLTTAFDPSENSLKIVIIGTPLDAAHLLKLLHLQLENLR